MNQLRCCIQLALLHLVIAIPGNGTRAAVTPVGNVEPALPWTTNTSAYIGRTSDGSLRIDGGSVVPSVWGYLGYWGAVTGEVTVTDPGSQWNNRSFLDIGRSGTGILKIENGGQVTIDKEPYVGRYAGSNGTATVTGAGSKLVSGYMHVGEEGTGMLNVTSGGLVTSTSAMIGYQDTATGTAIVSGPDSQWNVDGGMRVGWYGTGSLRIESGGQVSSGNNFNSWLAYHPDSNGTVTVTGIGSQWTSGQVVRVGFWGDATVDVNDGGVINTPSASLGFYSGSSGTVTVMGVGSKWNNTALFEVGTSGTGKLTVSDGGEVVTGTLYASLQDLYGNGIISATQGAVVDATLNFDAAHGSQALTTFGSGGTLKVKAAGGDLGVGYNSSGSLTVADGVEITSNIGYLAYKRGTTGTATVSGVGSKWTTTDDLNIGHYGTGLLTVENGGEVISDLLSVGNFGGGTLDIKTGGQVTSAAANIGSYYSATGLATVIGSDSRWDITGRLGVGDQGSTGRLNIQAGGRVSSGTGAIFAEAAGEGVIAVTGAGSLWTVNDTLSVGSFGTLEVADGGRVVANSLRASFNDLQGDGAIVATSGARLDADFVFDAKHPSQQVFAFGTGGTLTVGTGGELGVGYRDKGTLQILDGVTVNSTEGYIHGTRDTPSIGKVSGTGSRWALSGGLQVAGYLTIEQGSKVTSTTGIVENTARIFDNPPAIVTVTGNGSQWINSGELTVGYNGTGILIVKDGGVVRNTDGYLGRDQYEDGNGRALVKGTGSQWINSGSLTVGRLGYGELTITDGGEVTSNTGHLVPSYGDMTVGTSRVTVSGSGSKWSIAEDLQILDDAGGAVLTIKDGGEVSNERAEVSGNAIIEVTTIGSRWINRGSLTLFEGSALSITNGGEVSNTDGIAFGNASVKVSGPGSIWVNSGPLEILGYGGSSLVIEAGGRINSSTGRIVSSGSSRAVATIRGIGSEWALTEWATPFNDTLFIGPGATLNIRDGGRVLSSGVYTEGLLTIDVGAGSQIDSVDTAGVFTNRGIVRLMAGADALHGAQFSPIDDIWADTGTYEAIGGTWDDTQHIFTVSDAIGGVSGTLLVVPTGSGPRLLIDDPAVGRDLGISLLAQSGLTTLTGSVLDGAILDGLVEPGHHLLSAWDLSLSGSAVDDPLYLSFAVPSALINSTVSVWKWDGSFWRALDVDDLTVRGGFASFTASGGGAYALTVAVPEPATHLLGVLLALTLWRRRFPVA